MNRHKGYWEFILLSLFLGFVGIQEFYIGRTFLGVLAILFSWTCIPALVAIIEGVVCMFKGKDEFNKKFNKKEKMLLVD